MSHGLTIFIAVVIIILILAIFGWLIWWRFFHKEKTKQEGFLTTKRFKKTTHLISMNNKHKSKSGIVLESGKLRIFRNIELVEKLELKKWTARVSDQLSGIVIAAPGSGKTQSTILPTIMFNAVAKDKPRMIVTDPKGECYKATYKFLEQQGIKTYVLNFNDSNSTQHLYTHCFNPLSKIIELHKKYCATQDEIAKEIYLGKLTAKIDKFVNLFDSFNDENKALFWYKEGKSLAKFILSLMLFSLENKDFSLKNVNSYEQINLGNLYNNISQANLLELSKITKRFANNQANQKFENWFIKFLSWNKADADNLGSFQQNATQLLEIFKNPENQYLTAKSDFDLHDFLKKQSVLFLVLPSNEDKRKIANFFLEIFYDNLMEIVNNDYNDKLPFPCWFIVDEAGTMQSISWLGEVLNQGRGRNMHLLMVFQNTEQIDAKYKGQGLTKSTQYKILYSSQDLKYAEEIAKAIGYKQGAKNQQDLIIRPNEILKIEPEKALFVSVKENKPFFTNNLAFWKVQGINYEKNLYSQPIFALNQKYLKNFNFNEILGLSAVKEKAKVDVGSKQKPVNQILEEIKEKQLKNQEAKILEKENFTKRQLDELIKFFQENHFDDEDKKLLIINIYKDLTKILNDFYEEKDNQNLQNLYQRACEKIGLLWKNIDGSKWEYLKLLSKDIKNRKEKIASQAPSIIESKTDLVTEITNIWNQTDFLSSDPNEKKKREQDEHSRIEIEHPDESPIHIDQNSEVSIDMKAEIKTESKPKNLEEIEREREKFILFMKENFYDKQFGKKFMDDCFALRERQKKEKNNSKKEPH